MQKGIAHTDIGSGDWIDRRLPVRLRPYARLMRLDRPIGTWLLLWPCLWGLTLASDGWPRAWEMVLFALGAIVLRGAGCVINDMWDRDLDRRVERTRQRPLASGALTITQAFVFLLLLLLLGLIVLLQFNSLAVVFALAIVPLVILYPLAKRWTYWPQLVLGLAFNWGVWVGWAATGTPFSWATALLYVSGVFWTLAYDTIYAHQDRRDDVEAGVKSLALWCGDRSRLWVAAFFDGQWMCLAAAGYVSSLNTFFYIGVAVVLAHAFGQILRWSPESQASSLAAFRSNRDMGLFVWLALIAGKGFGL